ncbi:hypothetical protein [Fischerella thermalis]|uniref:hypothetical protein n=1 Tax=Fischerella thermalis TaxID=372787 RepID=UPI001CA53E66|nr:hypothetical protein [Fischerella thermalis]
MNTKPLAQIFFSVNKLSAIANDVFQEGQLWCMVMEYIQGENLTDRVGVVIVSDISNI